MINKKLSRNVSWKNNPNYKGWRSSWNFPCPKCWIDRITEMRHSDRQCRECYYKSRYNKKSQKEIRTEFVRKYKERRQTFKEKVIETYWWKCYVCKWKFHDCVYDFHHIDSTKKDKNPSALFRQSKFEKIKNELKLCLMLCSNCHRQIHWWNLKIDTNEAIKYCNDIWDNRTSLTYSQ